MSPGAAPPPVLQWCARAHVDVGVAVPGGVDLLGSRRVVPVVGGSFVRGWAGTIVGGGADWQTVLPDGTTLIRARYPVLLEGVGPAVFDVRGTRTGLDAPFCATLRVLGVPAGRLGATTYLTIGTKEGAVVTYDVYAVDTAESPERDVAPEAAPDDTADVSIDARFELSVDLLRPTPTMTTEQGTAMFIPIVGGHASGPALDGVIEAGGGDWAVERRSGAMDVHARYHLRTGEGTVVGVDNVGHWRERAGGQPYFVTAPAFVAPDGAWSWLTRGVFLGPALERSETQVVIEVYEVAARHATGAPYGS